MIAKDMESPKVRSDEDLLLLLRNASAGLTHLLGRELRSFGMTPLEYACLELISASRLPLTQRQIGERLRIDRSFAAKMILRLERRAWLRRVRHAHDGRQWYLLPTHNGRETFARVSRGVVAVYRRLQRPFGLDQWRECIRILRRLSGPR
jgi:DNA-binding MarR family transcriptional regulator